MRGRGRARYRDQNSPNPGNRPGSGDRCTQDRYQSDSTPPVQPKYSHGNTHQKNISGQNVQGKQAYTSQERYNTDGMDVVERTQSPPSGPSSHVRKLDRSKNRRPDVQVYVPKARRQQRGQNDQHTSEQDRSPVPTNRSPQKTRQRKAELEHYVPRGKLAQQNLDSASVYDDSSGCKDKHDAKLADSHNDSVNVSDDIVPTNNYKDSRETQDSETEQDVHNEQVDTSYSDFNNMKDELRDTVCSRHEQISIDLSKQDLEPNSDKDSKLDDDTSKCIINKISTNSSIKKPDSGNKNETDEKGKCSEEISSHPDRDQTLCDTSEHSVNDCKEPYAVCDKLDQEAFQLEIGKDENKDIITGGEDHFGSGTVDGSDQTIQCNIQSEVTLDSNLDDTKNEKIGSELDESSVETVDIDERVKHDYKETYLTTELNDLAVDEYSLLKSESCENNISKAKSDINHEDNSTSNLEDSSKMTQEHIVNNTVTTQEHMMKNSDDVDHEMRNTAEDIDDKCKMMDEINVDSSDNDEKDVDVPTNENLVQLETVDSYSDDINELTESVETERQSENAQFSESLVKDSDVENSTPSQTKSIAINCNQSQTEEVDEDSWDAMFDDDGECLDPSAMDELTKTVGKVKIRKSKKINYLEYQPKDKSDFDYSQYNHIIEIFDFPAEFVTRDLIMAFQSFMSRGFDLKWVDDTHALGIFSSEIAAQDALGMLHPLLKVCPLSQASKQSKVKAKQCTEFLQPYKPRPETSAAAARRLVAGALGLATNVSREKREKERQQLKEAKAKRRKDRQNREDIWEFGKCAMDEES